MNEAAGGEGVAAARRSVDVARRQAQVPATLGLRNRNESMETRADRMVIMRPDRTAITREKPQAFPIVHSFASGQAPHSLFLILSVAVCMASRCWVSLIRSTLAILPTNSISVIPQGSTPIRQYADSGWSSTSVNKARLTLS